VLFVESAKNWAFIFEVELTHARNKGKFLEASAATNNNNNNKYQVTTTT